jgi:hypothetical protein
MKHIVKNDPAESDGRIDTLTMAELQVLLANAQKERLGDKPQPGKISEPVTPYAESAAGNN